MMMRPKQVSCRRSCWQDGDADDEHVGVDGDTLPAKRELPPTKGGADVQLPSVRLSKLKPATFLSPFLLDRLQLSFRISL